MKRVGRCDAYATEFDLEAEEYVPLPKVRSPSLRTAHTVEVDADLNSSDGDNIRAVSHTELGVLGKLLVYRQT